MCCARPYIFLYFFNFFYYLKKKEHVVRSYRNSDAVRWRSGGAQESEGGAGAGGGWGADGCDWMRIVAAAYVQVSLMHTSAYVSIRQHTSRM